MEISRLILLVSLLLVILTAGVILFLDSMSQADTASQILLDTSAIESAVDTGVGEATAGEGTLAVNEATNLITKRLLLFIVGGIAGGILMLTFVIPMIADAVGTFFYSSEEEIEPDANALAIAKINLGDYEGAIEEFQKLMVEHPTDRFPVVEIAKLYLEKLKNPEGAASFLEDSLNDKEWPVDDAAFLMFRMIDIELGDLSNPVRAREVLSLIVENFEGTRHAANAQHRIDEIDAGTWAAND